MWNAGELPLSARLEMEMELKGELPAIGHVFEDFSPLRIWHHAGSPTVDTMPTVTLWYEFSSLSRAPSLGCTLGSTVAVACLRNQLCSWLSRTITFGRKYGPRAPEIYQSGRPYPCCFYAFKAIPVQHSRCQVTGPPSGILRLL